MGSEKFCLRWNDFESNISGAFRDIRNEKDFFDVTLACEDSQLDAHKVILSACSPFFRSILRRNPHNHPLLYLKGVKYNELLSILNFMYLGEVNVSQEDLNSFLAVAEELKVKGLTQNGKGGEPTKPAEKKPPERVAAPAVRRPPAPPRPVQEEEPEIEEVTPVVAAVKSEPAVVASQAEYQQTGAVAVPEESYDENYEYGYEGYDEAVDPNTGLPYSQTGADKVLEDHVRSLAIPDTDFSGKKIWRCPQCDYQVKYSTGMFRHIRRMHSFFCHDCTLFFQSDQELKIHLAAFH